MPAAQSARLDCAVIEVVFLAAPVPCRKCKWLCVTTKANGRIPMHGDCDTRFAMDELEPTELLGAMTNVARAFGPVAIDPPAPPCTPEEVGPCTACQHPTRRYGPFAQTRCTRCAQQRGTR